MKKEYEEDDLHTDANLRTLGVTKYESAVLRALVRLGPTSAHDIAKASGVPPTAVYPNLNYLIEKGLVQRLSSDKRVFEALDPKITIPALATKRKQLISEQANEAVQSLCMIPRNPLNQAEPVYLSLGLSQSHNIFLDMAKRAKKTFWVLGWNFRQATNAVTIIKSLSKMVERGIDVKMIAMDRNQRVKQIEKAGVMVRFFPMQNFSIMVRDGEESKITLKNPTLPDRLNIHVQDKDLNIAMHDYFLSIWKKAGNKKD